MRKKRFTAETISSDMAATTIISSAGLDQLTMLLAVAYLTVNLLAMAMYAFDKGRARRGGRRIPERDLLTLAFFGPFGALLGMRLFHHKTRKALFMLVPLFAALHVVLMYLLFLR